MGHLNQGKARSYHLDSDKLDHFTNKKISRTVNERKLFKLKLYLQYFLNYWSGSG